MWATEKIHSAWQLGYGLNNLKKYFDCQRRAGLSTASRPTLCLTHPATQFGTVGSSPEDKVAGEASYLHPPRAEIKKCGAVPPPPDMSSWYFTL